MDVKPRSENKKSKGVVHGVVGGETGKETIDVCIQNPEYNSDYH